MQGDFAKLQGRRRLVQAEGLRISMGWIGLSLIQGAGRPSFHSREVDLEAPVFFGDIYAAHFNVRFRVLPLKSALSSHMREKRHQLVAQFLVVTGGFHLHRKVSLPHQERRKTGCRESVGPHPLLYPQLRSTLLFSLSSQGATGLLRAHFLQ